MSLLLIWVCLQLQKVPLGVYQIFASQRRWCFPLVLFWKIFLERLHQDLWSPPAIIQHTNQTICCCSHQLLLRECVTFTLMLLNIFLFLLKLWVGEMSMCEMLKINHSVLLLNYWSLTLAIMSLFIGKPCDTIFMEHKLSKTNTTLIKVCSQTKCWVMLTSLVA